VLSGGVVKQFRNYLKSKVCHGWSMEGRVVEQQLVIIQEDDGFHHCGDYEQVVQEEQI